MFTRHGLKNTMMVTFISYSFIIIAFKTGITKESEDGEFTRGI